MRRNHTLRTSVALAAVTALLGACSEGSADSDDKADESPSSSSSTPVEESSTPADGDTLPDGVLALPGRDAGKVYATLEAGRYRVPLSDTLSFDVDVPQETFAHSDGYFLASGEILLNVTIADGGYGVPVHPCRDQSLEAVGPTVDDLVAAIRNRPVYRVSHPEPVELGGASGQYLEIRVPAAYDASSCQDGRVALPRPAADHGNLPPGYFGRWWILDIAGQRVAIQQFCGPCEPGASDRMAQTARTITFTPTS